MGVHTGEFEQGPYRRFLFCFGCAGAAVRVSVVATASPVTRIFRAVSAEFSTPFAVMVQSLSVTLTLRRLP